MKRKAVKLTAFVIVLVMAVGLAACGGGDNNTTTPTATNAPTTSGTQTQTQTTVDTPANNDDVAAPVRDLGGKKYTIGDWWTNNDAEVGPPETLRDEQLLEYREEIFSKHNFEMKQVSIGGWGEHLELFTTSVMAQDPAASVFIMNTSWTNQLMLNGLLYPLNDVEAIDLKNPKWNTAVSEMWTYNGNIYAATHVQYMEPRQYLFWNKRLYADSGIDPNAPYDDQKSGNWTWDTFLEYCRLNTRDTDGDGVADVYGFVAFEIEALRGFLLGNHTRFFDRGADGKYYSVMLEPAFVEAVQFGKSINQLGYWAPSPEGASWDWFVTGFRDGHASMIMREAYSADVWIQMDDEFGMVFPPKGPRSTGYVSDFSENTYVIPFNLPKQEIEDIMFAFNLYTEPLPYDIQNPDYWKDGAFGYKRFADTRAVDETIAMFYEGPQRTLAEYRDFVPGIDWGPVFDWGVILGAETAMEKIEAAVPVVEGAIADFYNR